MKTSKLILLGGAAAAAFVGYRWYTGQAGAAAVPTPAASKVKASATALKNARKPA